MKHNLVVKVRSLLAVLAIGFVMPTMADEVCIICKENVISGMTWDLAIEAYWGRTTDNSISVSSVPAGMQLKWTTLDSAYTGERVISADMCNTEISTKNPIPASDMAKANPSAYYDNRKVICIKFTKVQYSISVAGDGSGSASPDTYSIDTAAQTATISFTPKAGYSVSSWAITGYSGGMPSLSGSTLTISPNTYGNLTLTATTTPNTYNITVDPGMDGTGGGTITYKTSDSPQTLELSVVSHDRTKLKSWIIGDGLSSKPSISDDLTKLTIPANGYGSFTVTAKWDPYVITYNPGNGVSGGPSTQNKEHNVTAKLSDKKFSKTDYEQDGWSTTENGDKAYELNENYTKNDDLELWPHWVYVQKIYRLDVDTDGNGKVQLDPEYQYNEYPENTGVTLTAVPNDGYAFQKWNDGLTESVRTVTMTNAIWHKAYFTNRLYTIMFDPKEGSCDEKSRMVKYGDAIGTLPEPTLNLYTFDGWHTGSERSSPSVYGTDKYNWTSDITLYAHWNEGVKVKITGKVSPEVAGCVEGGGEHIQGSVVLLTAIANDGYSFAYWKDDPQNIASQRVVTASLNCEYEAVFTGNVYTVTFWADGGTPNKQTKMVSFGDAYGELPSVTWDEDGHYAFDAWYTDHEGDGDRIESDTVVNQAKNHSLYANWIEIPIYTLAYDGNGADVGSMADEEVACGEDHALASNAYCRTGYTFTGWATNATDTAIYLDGAHVKDLAGTNETATVYAAWSNNSYVVVYDLNGGISDWPHSLTNDCTYDVEFPIPVDEPKNPDELFRFNGWLCEATGKTYNSGDTVSNLTAEADGNVALKAQWEYDVGDYSRALGCTNLVFTVDEGNTGWSPVAYEPKDDPREKSVRHLGSGNDSLVAIVKTTGVLSFDWCVSHKDITLVLNGVELENPIEKYVWTSESVFINAAGASEIVFQIKNAIDDDKVYIANLTWTPGEVPHPVPGPGDEAVICMAAVQDGRFDMALSNKQQFAYEIWTNSNIAVPNGWALKDVTNSTEEVIIFSPEIDPAVPTMFYKVRTIQRP